MENWISQKSMMLGNLSLREVKSHKWIDNGHALMPHLRNCSARAIIGRRASIRSAKYLVIDLTRRPAGSHKARKEQNTLTLTAPFGNPVLPCTSEVDHVAMATLAFYCDNCLPLTCPCVLRVASHLDRIHLWGRSRRRQRRLRTSAHHRSSRRSFRSLSL